MRCDRAAQSSIPSWRVSGRSAITCNVGSSEPCAPRSNHATRTRSKPKGFGFGAINAARLSDRATSFSDLGDMRTAFAPAPCGASPFSVSQCRDKPHLGRSIRNATLLQMQAQFASCAGRERSPPQCCKYLQFDRSQPSGDRLRPVNQHRRRRSSTGPKPFATTVVADFDEPWAMTFLPARLCADYREKGQS
jgi:hypothetical protein